MDNAQSQDKGLVAYWNFDDGSGLQVSDRSGNGHDGLMKGAQWVRGKTNGALSFEKGGMVEIPNRQELQIKTDFTLTAWIKKTRASELGPDRVSA